MCRLQVSVIAIGIMNWMNTTKEGGQYKNMKVNLRKALLRYLQIEEERMPEINNDGEGKITIQIEAMGK